MKIIYICSTQQGGCGFIGHESELGRVKDEYDDFLEDSAPEESLSCPNCGADWVDGLDESNVSELADQKNLRLAVLLVENHESVVAIADCGCVFHAEDGIACGHSVKLARKRFYAGQLT